MALCCRLQKMYPREMGHNHRFALKRAERRQISKSLGDKAAERNRQNQERRMSVMMTHSHDSVASSMVDSTDSENGGYWAGKPIAPAKSPVKSPRPEPDGPYPLVDEVSELGKAVAELMSKAIEDPPEGMAPVLPELRKALAALEKAQGPGSQRSVEGARWVADALTICVRALLAPPPPGSSRALPRVGRG